MDLCVEWLPLAISLALHQSEEVSQKRDQQDGRQHLIPEHGRHLWSIFAAFSLMETIYYDQFTPRESYFLGKLCQKAATTGDMFPWHPRSHFMLTVHLRDPYTSSITWKVTVAHSGPNQWFLLESETLGNKTSMPTSSEILSTGDLVTVSELIGPFPVFLTRPRISVTGRSTHIISVPWLLMVYKYWWWLANIEIKSYQQYLIWHGLEESFDFSFTQI